MFYKGSLGFVLPHFVVVDLDMGSFKGVLWFVAIEKCLGRLVELSKSEIRRV
jgi:hypothetical protein